MSLQYFKHVFAWHALTDACPKCQRLNGNVYESQQLYMERLWDPIYGDIWDMRGGSLAHPNCRCQLEVRTEPVDIETILLLLQQLEDSLIQLNHELSTVTTGGT